MSTYTDVLFDLDGTLIDSLAGIHRSINKALALFSLPPVDEPVARGAVGHGVMNALRHCVRSSIGAAADEWFAVNGDAFAAAYRNEYSVGYHGVTVLYPGVAAMLERVSVSMRCFAVSNKPEAFCRSILTELGISSYFTGIVGEDTFSERKPSIIVWKELVSRYSLRRETVIMVGDGMADSEFGKNAGFDVCLVRYGITPPSVVDTYSAKYWVDSVEEAAAVVLGQ